MIEKIWLGVFYLSGWHISTCLCLPHQYHYVADAVNWTEAQTYCRETYTDLATIQNTNEMNQLINTLSSAGYSSEVWIGLYSYVDWQWSDGYTGIGADYKNWASNEPAFWNAEEYCVTIASDGTWTNYFCSAKFAFVCYYGTPLDPKFVLVNQKMVVPSAQTYCRENFIDLATVTSITENQKIRNMLAPGSWAWIGLFRNPNFFWSDQSSFSFSNFGSGENPIGSEKVICAFASLQSSGRWKFGSCEKILPFVCYSVPPVLQRQVVKLRITLDPSLEPNNLTVKEDLLKKLQDKLLEKGVSVVTLNWTEQADGKVFHKEDHLPTNQTASYPPT